MADIVVAGTGAVGLAAAVALARCGFGVIALGPLPAVRNGRTVALLDASVQMMRALGVWRHLDGRTAPLETMRIVDDTSSLFRPPPIDFEAAEIGLAAFGQNVENADLIEALAAEADLSPTLTRRDALLTSWLTTEDGVEVRTGDGDTVGAGLLIASDGGRSTVRRLAGIGVRERIYPQIALTAVLRHSRPHRNISTEFHTRQGPFTLVPLPPAPGAAHRSSLVWVMAPEEAERRQALTASEFAEEAAARARALLGEIAVEGRIGRFPIRRLVAKQLTGPRLVLLGEAAHALPPIGAQGLNLSLRDAATLVDLLAEARRSGGDPGTPALLARYERMRAGDVALRAFGVDTLNGALLASTLPMDLLRGTGLAVLARIGPLRRAAMRQGLRPSHDLPSLMR